MKVITDLQEFPAHPHFVAVALGNFDGVHRGHQTIIRGLVEEARREKGISVVFTFHPHPLQVLGSKGKLLLLNTPEDKEKLISGLGVDFFIPFPFDPAVADMTPQHFVEEMLIRGLRAKTIFVGYNFTFGRKATGDPALLKTICGEYDCAVNVIPEVRQDNIHISSTNIREYLLQGNMAMANLFLGYPYSLSGTVVRGNQLGRKLGFPTANLKVMPGLVIPEKGVYAVKVKTEQGIFDGVANIGKRPTLGNDLPESIEIHIFDQKLDLYEQGIRVFFLERLRPEEKFSDTTELTAQVHSDIAAAKQYLQNRRQILDLV